MAAADPRRARRAFIAANHPDRGGDPAAFAAGLAAFDAPAEPAATNRPTVVRSRNPVRRLRRVVRRLTTARRRRTHHTAR